MTSTISNILKVSVRNISSLIRNKLIENNVVWNCKNTIFNQQTQTTLYFQMASCSTEQNQIKRPRNLMIVGLCNHVMPKSRHSVGMQFVNRLATKLGKQWVDTRKCGGMVAVLTISEEQKVVLLKPTEPMNLNGKSVAKTAKNYNIFPQDIYLAHDELDKAVGKYSIKNGGSARGHNGVRSVMDSVRFEDMKRLLIGIDRPPSKSKVVEYVLADFRMDEQKIIDGVIKNSICLLLEDVKKTFDIDLLEGNKENIETQEKQ